MAIPSKLLRAELNLLKPFMDKANLETARLAQEKIGELMAGSRVLAVDAAEESLGSFDAARITPRVPAKRRGVILYLHGGGYVAGDIKYVKGFGSVLAELSGLTVLCPAYRLAPEHPYPAAVTDALTSWEKLIGEGWDPKEIVLCGESAGGGLIYALCLKLKELGRELPAGLIALSPWTDLSLSGGSYQINRERDPSLSYERLFYFAQCYGADAMEPLASPLFGDLGHLPPSLIFVGGDEILLDDAAVLHEKLLFSGCRSELTVKPDMWHVYPMYGVKEAKSDYTKMKAFIKDVLA